MRLSPFPHSHTNKRYHTMDHHLKQKYEKKAAKIPLDAGFTCPNRDGTKGVGGCAFCSARGSGDTVVGGQSILAQYEAGLERARRKWPDCLGIAYFQAYSNTYGKTEDLKALYGPVFAWEDVTEIAIATRPDCITEDFVSWLAKQAKPVWLEFGLQSAREQTMERLNRRHGNAELETAVQMCRKHGLPVCLHIINGLPGENRQDMVRTAEYVAGLPVQAVKIHMLHLLKGTALGRAYEKAPWPLLSQEEYVQTVCDQLERLPEEMIVERVTGDGIQTDLLAPLWTVKKTETANRIDQELVRRQSMQGAKR